MITATAGAEATIRIFPESARVSETGNFSVEVFIEPGASVSGAEFTLTYDPSLLEVTRVSEGSFLKQSGEQTIFSSGIIDNTNGTVSGVYGLMLGRERILGAGTFASIEFTALGKEDIALIELRDVTVTNSTGAKLPVSVTSGKALIGNVKESDGVKQAGHRQMTLGILALAGLLLAATRKI
ncbi:cohesin domain-containing protein [Methanolobus chelungpuianus]|uniref:cohesin domain-containing protein n=1 Tax=Methanolobus chelungpuianus TaxID=502115 RepID=UPI0021147EEF